MADDSSDLSSVSSLSSAPSDEEPELELKPQNGILKFFHKVSSAAPDPAQAEQPQRKRPASPPHEQAFADNPDIAFIVMFRKRFDSVLPKSLPHFGPHELEQDVLQEIPGQQTEHFLGALLALLLNRKQDIKLGQYNSALQEALREFQSEWPRRWNGINPLAGERKFATLAASDRLDLIRQLTYWTMSHSEVAHAYINTSYGQKRTTDDLNQALSVQPWGSDSDKRRYYLIEGDNDNSFRVYRESNPAGFTRTWYSVAGSIYEVKMLADKLATEDRGPNAKKLSANIMKNIANFEDKEEKRKRRDYRRQQKERFRRPDPGFSMYEGRTRGKRIRYNYSDEEGEYTEDSSGRRAARSTRNGSPVETGPVITASGRQSKPVARFNDNGSGADNSINDMEDTDMGESSNVGRPRRAATSTAGPNGHASKPRSKLAMDSDEEESEQDYGDDAEDGDEHMPDFEEEDEQDEDVDDAELDDDDEDLGDGGSPASRSSRIVKLPLKVQFGEDGRAKRLANGLSDSVEGLKLAPEPMTESQGADAPHASAANKAAISAGPTDSGLRFHEQNSQPLSPKPSPALAEKEPNTLSPITNGARKESRDSAPLAIRESPEKPHHVGLPPALSATNGNMAR